MRIGAALSSLERREFGADFVARLGETRFNAQGTASPGYESFGRDAATSDSVGLGRVARADFGDPDGLVLVIDQKPDSATACDFVLPMLQSDPGQDLRCFFALEL